MPQRSYGRLCGLARALELVGDRWTLLVIRQLLTGPKRYNDLLHALPAISTNLLAERLKRLEADGLVSKTDMAPPIATAVYELTEFGAAVEPAILELLRWGSALLADPARSEEPSDPDWPLFPIRWLARYHPAPDPVSIEFNLDDTQLYVSVTGTRADLDQVRTECEMSIHATSAQHLAAVFAGRVPLETSGLTITGDSTWLATALRVAYATPEPCSHQ